MVNNMIVGHLSFYLRVGWIKKGIDYLKKNNNENAFSKSNIEAIDELGIGSVMVQSLRFWLELLGIVKKENKKYVFKREIETIIELDPYLENNNILWLLHSYILEREDKETEATLWKFIFEERRNLSFTEEELLNSFNVYLEKIGIKMSERSLKDSISVFIKTYNNGNKDISDPEENIISPFLKLNYLKEEEGRYYFRTVSEKEISEYLVLYLLIKESKKLNLNELNIFDAYFNFNKIIKISMQDYEILINKLEKRNYVSLERVAGLSTLHILKMISDEEIIKRIIGRE